MQFRTTLKNTVNDDVTVGLFVSVDAPISIDLPPQSFLGEEALKEAVLQGVLKHLQGLSAEALARQIRGFRADYAHGSLGLDATRIRLCSPEDIEVVMA